MYHDMKNVPILIHQNPWFLITFLAKWKCIVCESIGWPYCSVIYLNPESNIALLMSNLYFNISWIQ